MKTKSPVLLLLLICVTLFSWTALRAQGVGGGLTGGVVTSQIDGDTWGGYNKWGYQIGGFAYYGLSDRLNLHIEIIHTHRGSREVVTDFGRVNLNYIDVPVLLQYKFPVSQGEFNAEAGISANLLLSAQTGFDPFQFDQTENYRRLSSELHLGSSYFFNDFLGIFGRWSIGMTNLNATPLARPWLTIHYFTLGTRVKLG